MSWWARVVLGGVLAVGLGACEAPAPAGQCGGFVCGDAERCDRETLTCVPDQAPVVTVVAPTAVVTSETFTVTGTVRDDVAVMSASWSFAGGDAQPVELGDDGAFSLSVTAPLVDEQAFDLVVTASDGPRSSEAVAVVRVDRVGPSISLLAPLEDVVVGDPAQVVVETRDASGAPVALHIGSTEVSLPTDGGTASATVPFSRLRNREAIEVPVRASDRHGNPTTRTFTLVGDNVPPEATLYTPDAGTTLRTALVRVAGSAIDPTPPVKVRARVVEPSSPDASFFEAAFIFGEGDQWSVEVPVPPGEVAGTVEVEVVDGLGNGARLTVPVVVDRVPPTASIDAPVADSLHRQAMTVTVTTSADTASVSATIGAGATMPLSGGPTTWTGVVPLPTRDYVFEQLVVLASDAAGNAVIVQRQVLIDTMAPRLTFLAPAVDEKFNISDFSATNDVSVNWQVSDGDPQAAVTQVNGAPSAATLLLVTTSPADNGRVVTTTVSATDRAGNTSTASRTFSVDRVAPTVSTWVPAASSRNVDPRTTSITFSEPVFGSTASTDALALTPAPTTPGGWNTAHTTWTSAALTPYTVFDASLAALADDHGNPVAGATRRFHTAALAASTPPTTPLATGVAEFRVAADGDGVVTVAWRSTAAAGNGARTFFVHRLSPQTMTLEPALDEATLNVTDFGLNAWSTVNATTLVARNIAAYSWTTPMTVGPSPLTQRRRVENGTSTSAPTTAIGPAAALSVLPSARETDQADFGYTEASTYTRGAATVTLPVVVNHHVAQSSDSWAGFRLDASAVRWARFRCNRYAAPAPGYNQCEGIAFGAPTSGTPSQLSAAMNRTGSCLIASWSEGGQRRALAQPLPNCDGAPATLCPSNTNLSSTSQADGFSVAPWSVGSTSSLLAAYQEGFTVRLGTLSDPATCNLSFTNVGPALAAQPIAWAPVQLGQKAALFYLDSGNALRVYVP